MKRAPGYSPKAVSGQVASRSCRPLAFRAFIRPADRFQSQVGSSSSLPEKEKRGEQVRNESKNLTHPCVSTVFSIKRSDGTSPTTLRSISQLMRLQAASGVFGWFLHLFCGRFASQDSPGCFRNPRQMSFVSGSTPQVTARPRRGHQPMSTLGRASLPRRPAEVRSPAGGRPRRPGRCRCNTCRCGWSRSRRNQSSWNSPPPASRGISPLRRRYVPQ